MKRIDITGNRYGKLVVLEYLGNARYRCRCDCGNETIVFSGNLRKGHTTSCGCKKGTGIVGKKFGKLFIESRIEGTDKYHCVCDCGNVVTRNYHSLMQNTSRIRMCDDCANEIRIASVKQKVFVDGTQPSRITLSPKPTKANKSGVVGVNWDKSRNKWQASIRFKGHKYNLGRFTNIQDAIDIRKKAEQEIFGEFLEWYNNQKK